MRLGLGIGVTMRRNTGAAATPTAETVLADAAHLWTTGGVSDGAVTSIPDSNGAADMTLVNATASGGLVTFSGSGSYGDIAGVADPTFAGASWTALVRRSSPLVSGSTAILANKNNISGKGIYWYQFGNDTNNKPIGNAGDGATTVNSNNGTYAAPGTMEVLLLEYDSVNDRHRSRQLQFAAPAWSDLSGVGDISPGDHDLTFGARGDRLSANANMEWSHLAVWNRLLDDSETALLGGLT